MIKEFERINKQNDFISWKELTNKTLILQAKKIIFIKIKELIISIKHKI
ncbi:hypothetical protein [Mesoplasma florum]|nr:hypothetical protein [Mesoplasma florum]